MYNILAIDDDEHYLEALQNFLKFKNYTIVCAASPYKALDILKESSFDCILSDVKMPGMDGLELLSEIKKLHPAIPVIMISGQSTISIAVDAIQHGAYDFIEKASPSSRIIVTIDKAIEKKNWSIERQNLLIEVSEKYRLIGNSSGMQHVFGQIQMVAPTDSKVLILGETGTGKELVARAIHHNSPRNGQKFVPVNCASIPETLLESELFGHTKGSFTGAISDKPGKFMLANGGTLFLDEIGDLSLSLQAKLLRVLEDSEIQMVGSNKTIKLDIRFLSATNKNLEAMIEEGTFRQDLYHRLNVISIKIPSLNERRQDVPLLAEYFLEQYAKKYNKQLLSFSPQAIEILKEFDWKGNVRQLKNIIEKISILTRQQTVRVQDVFMALEMESSQIPAYHIPKTLKDATQQFERDYIYRNLAQNDWKMQQTADILGIDRTTLFKKIQQYAIKKPSAQPEQN